MKADKVVPAKINEFIKKLKADKKILFTFLLAAIGTLMVLIPSPSAQSDEKHQNDENGYVDTRQLETRLEHFVEKIKGAGECKVMITFDCSEEKIYAKNGKQTVREDSSESTREYIIVDSGNTEEGLTEYVIYPKVRGVAIVCSGADDPVVKQRIVSSVSALFSLSTNKISVISMIQ